MSKLFESKLVQETTHSLIEILTDTETGVQYIVVHTLQGLSITPRLHGDGRIYITKKEE